MQIKCIKMASALLILTSLYLLNIFIYCGAQGVNIQLYRHRNFTELVWKSNSSADCINIPQDKIDYVYSIRTDTCFIAYNSRGCRSSRSMKYFPGDTSVSSSQNGWLIWVESFHICNNKEGGDQLDIDFNTHTRYFVPKVVESYKHVCSCVNVPKYVQNMDEWYIDNHHNGLFAYYEPNCSKNKWKPEFIAAGHNDVSTNIYIYKKTDSITRTTYKIQSLGPDSNSDYFKASCSPQIITKSEPNNLINGLVKSFPSGSPEHLESTTGSVMDVNSDVMTTQVDKSKENLDTCQTVLESFNEKLDKLAEIFTQFQQNVKKFLMKFNLTNTEC